MNGAAIVLADDLAGSGKTLSKLFDAQKTSLRDVSRLYPCTPIYILLIAAYEDALREVHELIKAAKSPITIEVYRILTSRDRCFSEDSQIFPSEDERAKMKAFCYKVASQYFPKMPEILRLGYRGIGSLCVLHNTVPNNTLPLIWYDNPASCWHPLFPARGLEATTLE